MADDGQRVVSDAFVLHACSRGIVGGRNRIDAAHGVFETGPSEKLRDAFAAAGPEIARAPPRCKDRECFPFCRSAIRAW